jgi:cell division protein FtsL
VTGPKPGAHSLSTLLWPGASIFNMVHSPRANVPGTGASRTRAKSAVFCSVSDRAEREIRHPERGAGHLKAVIWTVILVAFIYVAAMLLPVLINEYEFQDSLQNIARFASVNRRSNEQVKQAVLEEAQKEDLPVQADDIKVQGNAGNIQINVEYSITVDLKVYQWTLNFHPAATNAALL